MNWTRPPVETLASCCHTLVSRIYNYRLRIWKAPYSIDSKMWLPSTSKMTGWGDEMDKKFQSSSSHRLELPLHELVPLAKQIWSLRLALPAVANNSPDNSCRVITKDLVPSNSSWSLKHWVIAQMVWGPDLKLMPCFEVVIFFFLSKDTLTGFHYPWVSDSITDGKFQ